MDKTRVMIEFAVVGDDFDITAVTEKLQVTPSKYGKKEDAIKKRQQKNLSPTGYEQTSWVFKTDYEESINADRQLTKLVDLFKPKIPILKTIANIYNVEFAVNIVIEIYNNDIPSIYFNSTFIEFIHEIGAEVDIDLYIL